MAELKKHFEINGLIKFNDFSTNSTIPDDILPDYINQYKCVPGWRLEVVDVYIESQGPHIALDSLEGVEEIIELSASNCSTIHAETINTQETNVDETKYLAWTELGDTVTVSKFLNTNDLQNLEDLKFQIILRQRTENCLENSDRTKVAKIIIKYILQKDVNIELCRQDYIYLTELIHTVFPHEPKDIYYSPAKFGQKASGKLFDAYNNLRKRLSLAGFLKRRSYSTKNTTVAVHEEETNDFVYVKTNSSLKEDYIVKWNACLSERQQLLRIPELSTSDYLSKFPSFISNDNSIFTLLKSDVNALYPSYGGITSWGDYYLKIFQSLKTNKDCSARKLIKSSEGLSTDSKKAVAFLLLPYMFPSTVVRRQTKK